MGFENRTSWNSLSVFPADVAFQKDDLHLEMDGWVQSPGAFSGIGPVQSPWLVMGNTSLTPLACLNNSVCFETWGTGQKWNILCSGPGDLCCLSQCFQGIAGMDVPEHWRQGLCSLLGYVGYCPGQPSVCLQDGFPGRHLFIVAVVREELRGQSGKGQSL